MRGGSFFVAAILLAGALFLALGTESGGMPVQQIAAAPTATPAADNTPETRTQETFRVLKIVDGDTLALDMNGQSITVRLIGLDTPETMDPRKPVQCFGKEASDKAKELLDGALVSIETDGSQGERDKYGRLLAYIFLPEGTLFNKYMISEGYGHEYTYDLPYKYQTEFKTAERSAREQKKGLWADTACANTTSASKAAMPVLNAGAGGTYDCSRNIYNCTSFKTQAEAQSAFESCGGPSNDVHKLDSDKDGSVCESLP